MEHAPDSFVESLHSQSGGRFRIRWSPSRLRWQIEQKKARGIDLGRPVSVGDDERIRERDGFTLVVEICPGSNAVCDRCQKWMKVTEQQMKTSRCPHCKKEHQMFFWELGDGLLEHLRKIDPDRGGIERVFKETEEGELQRQRAAKRGRKNHVEAVTKEDWNYLHEIQSVGFTGKNRFIHRDKGLK